MLSREFVRTCLLIVALVTLFPATASAGDKDAIVQLLTQRQQYFNERHFNSYVGLYTGNMRAVTARDIRRNKSDIVSQDIRIQGFKVRELDVWDGDNAIVEFKETVSGPERDSHTVKADLVKQSGTWKIVYQWSY